MKKVLLIEDEIEMLGVWQDWLKNYSGEKLILISASSVQEAGRAFHANQDVQLIVIDGRILGPDGYAPPFHAGPNTLGLISEFRKTFLGPMIAVSGDEDTRERMVEVGCTEGCEKIKVASRILELLGVKKKEKQVN